MCLLVRGESGLRAQRLVVASADKIEQYEASEISDNQLSDLLTSHDGKCISPLVVHKSCLFVGLNEQIWEHKIRA